MINIYYWPFQYGARSKANRELQRRLGISVDLQDGIFGNDTRNTLLAYQKRNGLQATGVVDRPTEDLLFPGNYERRTPSMQITSNWLSGLVTSTGFKYVLTAIGTWIAAYFGIEGDIVVAVLTQLAALIPAVWGMYEAAKSKAVVNGTRVDISKLPVQDQQTIAKIVQVNSNP